MSTQANPTALSPRSPSPGLFGALPSERSLWPFVGSVALVALWFLRRRYNGLLHNSMIYMGRGLADLDPSGVGADYFYRLDGQSSFSVFSKIVDALIPVFGLALSAQLLTVTALVLWLAAMAALAAQLASGRLKWAILICVAAASGAYGGLPLQYAEAFATPRPFAEAGVLAALAALLAGSRPLAVLFLGLAALFHPIMALAGAGAVYVYLCLENRRWIYLGLAGALCVLVAALGWLAAVFAPRRALRLELADRPAPARVLSVSAAVAGARLDDARGPRGDAGLRRDSRDGPDQAPVLVGDRREPRRAAARGGFRRYLSARADRSGAAVAGDLAVDAVRNHRRVFLRGAPLGGGRREPRVARFVRDRLDRRRIEGERAALPRGHRAPRLSREHFSASREALDLLLRRHRRADRDGRNGRACLYDRRRLEGFAEAAFSISSRRRRRPSCCARP